MTEELVEYIYDDNDVIIGKKVKYIGTETEVNEYRKCLLEGEIPVLEKDEEFIEVVEVSEAAIHPGAMPLLYFILAFIRLMKMIH